jgi:hypothetical protein
MSEQAQIDLPAELHKDSKQLVIAFATALGDKLRANELKYGYTNGWKVDDWREKCLRDLRAHIDKGDPLDIAAYAAFMWYRGWK